jgi:hypothetical protein
MDSVAHLELLKKLYDAYSTKIYFQLKVIECGERIQEHVELIEKLELDVEFSRISNSYVEGV